MVVETAFRLDDLVDTGKMLRKGAAIDRARPGNPVPGRSIRLILKEFKLEKA